MRYHVVGIAGSGMSAIAHLLLDQGHTVSGSDTQQNHLSALLAARGALLALGHDAAHVAGADALLVTSAAPADHLEVAAARRQGIPVLKRADLWQQWSSERDIVAVAGTHGKTTTAAMIALALEQAGLDPGYLIGAPVRCLAAPARWGSGPLVIEADEYDYTFLALRPQIAVITNITWDHVDCFADAQAYGAAFTQFASQAQAALIGCTDDDGVRQLHDRGSGPLFQGYGTARNADWQIVAGENEQGDPVWTLHSPLGHEAAIELAVPGAHNRLNAAAATVACGLLGLAPEGTLRLLREFGGAERRFETKGEAGGVLVIDDYAHHPEEARATLAAARERFPQRRMVAYVQPHTYSRTAAFVQEWAESFADADVVRVGAIYGAREQADEAMSGAALAARISHGDVAYVGEIGEATARLLVLLAPGDLLLTMGAGDGWKVGTAVLAALQGTTP